MKNTIGFAVAFLICLLSRSVFAAPPSAQPCDIVNTVSHFVIPRIHAADPTTLQEVLDWIRHRFRDGDTGEEAPQTSFVFEYRLSEATLHRIVTMDARNITMIQAIKQVFGDTPVVLMFETGKLIFSEPAIQKSTLDDQKN